MNTLMGLQNQFQNYLLLKPSDITQSVVSTEKVPVAKRLAIYGDGYRFRLIDSLSANFPILNAYIGFEAFKSLAIDYIDKFPSTYRSIRWYGDSFADYLKESGNIFAAELAEFEWKMTLSFDAADDEILKIEQMAAIPPESWAELRFQPHSSLHLMNFKANVIEIWEAVSNDHRPPQQKTAPTVWVLWRKNYINHFSSLTEVEAWALEALFKGTSFGELCEGLCRWFDEQDVAMQAASLLKGWIEREMIAGIMSEEYILQ